MTKKTKQYLYSVLLIIVFAFFSVIKVSLIFQKGINDIILLYSIACFLFLLWLGGSIFPVKSFRLIYKLFQKPMSKSTTLDIMGTSVVSEKKAYETFLKMIKKLPYIYLAILILGIILLLLA